MEIHEFAARQILVTRNSVILLTFQQLEIGRRRAKFATVMLDRVAGQLERYMDLLSARQKLVAANIANADTPGYHTKDIDFQREFLSAARSPQIIEPSDLKVKNDGNNVSLDRESRLLAENALRFQLAAQLIKGQVRAVRSAIQEGKGS
jgi:flagellar basal-body rod protein FlgB